MSFSNIVVKKFSVDTNSEKLFDILTSKIYSDPISSIVQEVISNARDAHREANVSLPIEVELNSKLSFSVKDYGPGISPDRMDTVFLKYLATTKMGDENQTGGFGLGAKTPFAYTDNFEIVTIHEGVKYQYIASIGGSASGEMIMVSSEDTTDHSGTTIKVPIKNYSDLSTFRVRLNNFCKYFNYPLRISDNEHISFKEPVVTTTKFNFHNSQHHLVLDGIFYPLDNQKITEIISSIGNPKLNIICNSYGFGLSLNFDSRNIDVSVNRELIRYTPRSIENIKNKIIGLFEEEDLKAKKLIDKMVEGDYFNNFLLVKDQDISYYFKIFPEHKYLVNTFFGYSITDGIKKIPSYELSIALDKFNKDDKFIYLDKNINDISFGSIKKLINGKDYRIFLTRDKFFDKDEYPKASEYFAAKKKINSASSKKIFFKCNQYGKVSRIAYQDIPDGVTNILVEFDSVNQYSDLVDYQTNVIALKGATAVKEALEEEFTDPVDHLTNIFPTYEKEYAKYVFWKKNLYDKERNSYNLNYALIHLLKFSNAYSDKRPDEVFETLNSYRDKLILNMSNHKNRNLFSLFEKHGFVSTIRPDYLDDLQKNRLYEMIRGYLEIKVPTFPFISYTYDSLKNIIKVL